MIDFVLNLLVLGVVIPRLLNGQIVMKFCSGRSIRCSVSSRTDERLILDASNTAIISQEFLKTLPTGVTSCTCTIRYGGLQVSELPDQDTSDMRTADSTSNKRLSKLFVRHRADGTNNCGKSIEVTKFGLVSSFGCISRDLQLQNIPIDGNVTMILNVETPKPRDRLYQVVLEPDGVTAVFYVTCWPPVFPNTTPLTTSSESPSLATLPELTSEPPDRDNTGVVVGVVTSVTVMGIAIIVGVLCMRRRNRQKNDRDGKIDGNKDTVQKKDITQDRSYYNNLESSMATESHIYDYIRPEDVRREPPITREPSITRNATTGTNSNTIHTISTYSDNNRTSVPFNSTKSNTVNGQNSAKSSRKSATSRNQNNLHYTEGYLEPFKPKPDYLEILPS